MIVMNLSFKDLAKIILLLLLLSPASLLVEAQHKTNNLITDTCKKTPNYALCVSTLTSNPRSSTADVGGLGYIVVETVKAKSTAGLKSISELSRSNPMLKERLSECLESYKNILNDFIPEAEQGPPKFAEDGMNGVAEVTEKCVKNFQGLEAPLSTTNKLVHDLSLVAASIIRTLL
ncbi:Cell wall vacuolar inhibitor of fructosidase 1 [Heracleum sosnowskyi]|uniref:Cell wall vacuolar inhibitor of fructosidase 1 n=1 Tax=Heracleum sosnowskyi TaxID=360622 RepID=A0AAD8ISQ3_9APIA|nr:Cell wall vacuolar inhibitor of fructosidase 1 [Heracleum sosnowskyi]